MCTATVWLSGVAAAHAAALPCDKLAGQTFGNARILETQDISGRVPLATMYGGNTTLEGPVCRVLGESRPTPDSSIRFEIWLPAPDAWNGRYQGVGNGGNAGTPVYPTMANALKGAYAVSGHDTGHVGAMGDSSYAIGHPERVIDFGWRSLHEVALASKAVIQAYYGRPAELSLYNGCSTGGRQGLALAQRFPADYDGIAAGAPANYWPELNALHADFLRFLREDPARWVSPEKLEMVQGAVREECGAVDGILDDPASCRFDLSKLSCAGGGGPDCLTNAERESLQRRFTDLVDEKGKLVYPSFAHGLETEIGGNWIGRSAEERGVSARAWTYPVGFFRDYVHGDPGWQVTAFDPTRDLPAARQGLIGFSVAAEDPDLSRFATRGGKLLQYHGWHDMSIPARNSIRYYEEVARAMGGREAIAPFYRLFLGTGMGHCGGGNGPNAIGGAFGLPAPVRDADHDVIEALAAWIRNGRAPEKIVATRYGQDGRITAQRPWCAYPEIPVWDGVGDRSVARSYSCRPRP
jgi:feruloyl esterase